MLDQHKSELARRLIEAQFAEQRNQLDREINRIQEKMYSQGIGQSGIHYKLVRDLCARELAISASIVWHCLVRVLSSSGFNPSEALSNSLKAELQEYLSQEQTDLQVILQTKAAQCGVPRLDTSLSDEYEHALNKFYAEIDLWVLNQQRVAEAAGAPRAEGQPTIIVQDSAVAIQTGTGATASVTFISSEDRKAIQEAVERALEAVRSAADLPNKEEVTELLEEVHSEAKKDEPNGMRLRSLLGTVAATISTVASLGTAYQTLKGVASLVGIQLP